MGVSRAAQSFHVPPIISGTGKATDFEFGRYIHRVHPNKRPLKILEKRERGHIQGLPKVFEVPPIISGMGKTTNFKFCTHFHMIDHNKSPLTISGKVVVGVARDSRNFSCYPYYRVHRAVIFAIAQLSCSLCIWLNILMKLLHQRPNWVVVVIVVVLL